MEEKKLDLLELNLQYDDLESKMKLKLNFLLEAEQFSFPRLDLIAESSIRIHC